MAQGPGDSGEVAAEPEPLCTLASHPRPEPLQVLTPFLGPSRGSLRGLHAAVFVSR